MQIRQTAIDRTIRFEVFVGYLYLDSNGKVTAGYGHMIPSADDAVGLNLKSNGAAATDQAKRDEWTTISGQAVGHAASYYQKFTTLTFDEADASALLKSDLKDAASDLADRFSSLDDYPNDAQDALLDMIFNIGKSKFNSAKWPGLFAAVQAKDWTTAAAKSHRSEIPESRNNEIRDLFLSAAGPATTQITAARSAFESQLANLDEFLQSAHELEKFFPNGITRLKLSVKAGAAELGLEIEGPERAARSTALGSFMTDTASDIIAKCEDVWDANKSDCSAFVKAVASQYAIVLNGVADDIVDTIHGADWEQLADGVAAKAAADDGKLVIGGLKGASLNPPQKHGHVVLVVSGPLAKGKYPTGYWGKLDSVGAKNTTINYAFNPDDRDNVLYAAKAV